MTSNPSKRLGALVLLSPLAATSSFAVTVPESLIRSGNTIDAVVDSMRGPHAERPSGAGRNGVPFDWASGPRVGYGNNPPSGWDHVNPWGQVYEPVSGNPAENVAVEVRHIQLSILDANTDTWFQLDQHVQTQIDGGYFLESYDGPPYEQAPLYNGSTTARFPGGDDQIFHFWDRAWRQPIPEGVRIGGLISSIEARIVSADTRPGVVQDVDSARLMMAASSDYWDADDDTFASVGDSAIGRFGFLTQEFQTFNMTTLTEADFLRLGMLDLAGDFDRDARADLDDVDPFVLAFNDAVAYDAMEGLGAALRGDMNADGVLDRLDVPLFEAAVGVDLSGRLNVPEPATAALLALGGLCLLRRRR